MAFIDLLYSSLAVVPGGFPPKDNPVDAALPTLLFLAVAVAKVAGLVDHVEPL